MQKDMGYKKGEEYIHAQSMKKKEKDSPYPKIKR
jgi:hypothetical protein